MTTSTSRQTIILLLISIFGWGSVFPLSKLVLEQMSQHSLVVWRFTIAALCLVLYLPVHLRRHPAPWPRLSWRQYLWLISISLVGVGGFNLLLFSGVKHTAATNGALVMALSPLVTALMVALLSRRWLTGMQSASLALGLAGVLLVITNGSWHSLQQFAFNQGDLTIIGAMLLWSAYTTASQQATRWLPVVPYTLISMLAGDLFILLASGWQGNVHPLDELLQLSLPGLLSMLYIGVVGTVLAYLFFLQGVQKLGSATASLFFNLIPVFAALTALLLGQQVSLVQAAGMAIVLLALMLPQLYNWLKPKPKLLNRGA
ncbi:DMT family transporter [Rheinheimera sp.]|uniref:DMT family transporter n=1 Tax=Rheinheimera sp. TaxID=1869214 RepID=UPI00307F0B2A